jgi:hypothetical protein
MSDLTAAYDALPTMTLTQASEAAGTYTHQDKVLPRLMYEGGSSGTDVEPQMRNVMRFAEPIGKSDDGRTRIVFGQKRI